jgi:hypothetical protein
MPLVSDKATQLLNLVEKGIALFEQLGKLPLLQINRRSFNYSGYAVNGAV